MALHADGRCFCATARLLSGENAADVMLLDGSTDDQASGGFDAIECFHHRSLQLLHDYTFWSEVVGSNRGELVVSQALNLINEHA
jgi:hypothetical protein